ncbi:MAG: hypothetical protein HYX72_06305 [Acidobacteria bacterium]|nr:hypothetical protein [Acidobacteriota bacterium]
MPVELLLLGAIALSCVVAGVFFLRFWKTTRDRFFLFFAVSFFAEGLNRFALGLTAHPNEAHPFFYIVRFLSFCLILIAIIGKNVAKGRRAEPAGNEDRTETHVER